MFVGTKDGVFADIKEKKSLVWNRLADDWDKNKINMIMLYLADNVVNMIIS